MESFISKYYKIGILAIIIILVVYTCNSCIDSIKIPDVIDNSVQIDSLQKIIQTQEEYAIFLRNRVTEDSLRFSSIEKDVSNWRSRYYNTKHLLNKQKEEYNDRVSSIREENIKVLTVDSFRIGVLRDIFMENGVPTTVTKNNNND